MGDPIKIRGHHFLCMLSYVGMGYTDKFTANFTDVVARIEAGEPILITSGADDVCAALGCAGEEHEHWLTQCQGVSTKIRDTKALADVSTVLGQPFQVGMQIVLNAERIALLRQAFAAGKIRTGCVNCDWYDTCTGIAAGGFCGVKLFPHKD